MLMSLMLANTLQGVQEYVNQPSFQPSEILLQTKYIQEIGFGGITPLYWASCILPSFDITGVLLQKLDEAGLREKVPPNTGLGNAFLQRNENIR